MLVPTRVCAPRRSTHAASPTGSATSHEGQQQPHGNQPPSASPCVCDPPPLASPLLGLSSGPPPQDAEPADALIAALGLAASRDLGFPPEPRLSGAGEPGRRREAVPYNGAGHWCKYADLRRAAGKHVDDADAAIRAVLERFGLWDFYDHVGRERAHVKAAPRQDGRPLTDAANKSGAPRYLQRKNVVVGLRWEVRVSAAKHLSCVCPT